MSPGPLMRVESHGAPMHRLVLGLRPYPLLPVGTVVEHAGGPLLPDGWRVCDGSPCDSPGFRAFVASLGNWPFGRSEDGVPLLPDMRGRAVA